MLNYLIRSKTKILEASSGALLTFATVHDDIDTINNNKSGTWFRGTFWYIGAQISDIKSSASLEIINNELIFQFTTISIDGISLIESTHWEIKDTAAETISSIKLAIDNHSILSTRIDTFIYGSKIYFKSKLAGPGYNYSFEVNSLSGLKINNQNSDLTCNFAGGINSGKIFNLYKFDQQSGSFVSSFNEEDNEDRPTTENLPKSCALFSNGLNLYYLYIKDNWDNSKLVLGYRIFSLVDQFNDLILSATGEEIFSISPQNYLISDLINFKDDLFLSLTDPFFTDPSLVFKLNLNSFEFSQINNLSHHTGVSEQFLIVNDKLYSINSNSSAIGNYESNSQSFITAGNPNFVNSDKKFKIGAAVLNNEIYLAYTDSFWQGQVSKTSSLDSNVSWNLVDSFGNPLIYQNISLIENQDLAINNEYLILYSQSASGAGNLYYIYASGAIINQDIFYPITDGSGLYAFNRSHPDVLIENITTNYSGNIKINYRVYDQERDIVNIRFEYSIDSGLTWLLGSIASGSQDMGTILGSGVLLGLSSLENNKAFSNNGGISHYFDWDSKSDLSLGSYSNVKIRLTGYTGSP